jgi:uncharacterized membrane protein
VASAWWLGYLALLGLFIGGALLAPVLDRAGLHRPASLLYLGYRVTCHQLPHHSWFIGGPRAHYAWADVQPYTGVAPGTPSLAFHRPVRSPDLGYQMAFCQRDTAIWLGLLGGSVAALLIGRRRHLRMLGLRRYGLAVLPMAVDGFTQLFGWRESTPLLRSLTGGLFGVATAFLVVPLLAEGFRDLSAPAPRRPSAGDRPGPAAP